MKNKVSKRIAALSVSCPTCGRSKGLRCRRITPDYQHGIYDMKAPHSERYAAYDAAQAEKASSKV